MPDPLAALIKKRAAELARLLEQGPPSRGLLRVGYLHQVEELRLDLQELLFIRRRIRFLERKPGPIGRVRTHD